MHRRVEHGVAIGSGAGDERCPVGSKIRGYSTEAIKWILREAWIVRRAARCDHPHEILVAHEQATACATHEAERLPHAERKRPAVAHKRSLRKGATAPAIHGAYHRREAGRAQHRGEDCDAFV